MTAYLAVDGAVALVLISYFMIMKYQKKVVLGLCASWVSVCSLFAVGDGDFAMSGGMEVFMPRPAHLLHVDNLLVVHVDDDDGQVVVNGVNDGNNIDQRIVEHGAFLVGMGLTPAEIAIAEGDMRLEYEQGLPLEDLGARAFFIMRGLAGEAVTVAVNRTRELWAQEGMFFYEAPWRALFELIGLDEPVALMAYTHMCLFISQHGMPLNIAYVYGMFAAYGYHGDVINALVDTFWQYVGAQLTVQQSFWRMLYQCVGVPADNLDWAWERQQHWVGEGYTLNQAFRIAIFETEGLPPGAAVQAYQCENIYLLQSLLPHHAHWLAFYRVLQVPLNYLDVAYQEHQNRELGEGVAGIESRVLRVIAAVYGVNAEGLLNSVKWRQKNAKYPMGFFEALFRHIMYKLKVGMPHLEAKPFVDGFCENARDTNVFLATTKRR